MRSLHAAGERPAPRPVAAPAPDGCRERSDGRRHDPVSSCHDPVDMIASFRRTSETLTYFRGGSHTFSTKPGQGRGGSVRPGRSSALVIGDVLPILQPRQSRRPRLTRFRPASTISPHGRATAPVRRGGRPARSGSSSIGRSSRGRPAGAPAKSWPFGPAEVCGGSRGRRVPSPGRTPR
jgi:hypothetical protein